MRVLLLHNAYQQPGGEDAVVQQEADALRAEGHDVELYVVSNDDLQSRLKKVVTVFHAGYNPAARRAVEAVVRRVRPDVAHVHNFFPQLSPSIFDAFIDAGVPSVMTLHNFRILCPTATLHHRGRTDERSLHGSCWWTVPKRVYRGSFVGSLAVAAMVERHKRQGTWRDKVGRFIVLTEFARTKFIEGGLSADRLIVKPNSVSASPAPAEEASRQGVLFVGRLTEDKGLRSLVEAWRALNVPLTIVGEGPLRAWIDKAAPPNVQVVGRKSAAEVRAYMRQAALLIVPSLWHEMLPMTVLEAFASRLPVLASDTPSLRSLICQDGLEAGALAPAGDPPALATAVRAALADPARLNAWRRAAGALYIRHYTPEANSRQLRAVYEGVIAEGARRARGQPGPTRTKRKQGRGATGLHLAVL